MNPQVQRFIGNLYYSEYKDIEKSTAWLRKAISSGLVAARLDLFDLIWNNAADKDDELLGLVIDLETNYDALLRLVKCYQYGRGTDKDLEKALAITKDALDNKKWWAPNKYVELLWDINTPESISEMISYALPLAKSGNPGMQRFVSKIYCDGRGVPKDLDKAAEWMRKAAEKDHRWSNELFDILWKIGTQESFAEMIDIASNLAEEGNAGAMGRLGRAYRDGKGVQKDVEKAAEWMRKAAEKNPSWNYELGILLRR